MRSRTRNKDEPSYEPVDPLSLDAVKLSGLHQAAVSARLLAAHKAFEAADLAKRLASGPLRADGHDA